MENGGIFEILPGSCVSSVAAGVPATESTPVSRSAYRDPRLMAVTNPMEGRRTPKRMYRSSFSGNKTSTFYHAAAVPLY